MKQLFEFFPLIVFFVVYYKSDKDLYLSITAVIIATLISLVALYIKERKISTMMLVSTVILVVFGGLSIFLKNDQIYFLSNPNIDNNIVVGFDMDDTLHQYGRIHPLKNKRLFSYHCDASNEYHVNDFFEKINSPSRLTSNTPPPLDIRLT